MPEKLPQAMANPLFKYIFFLISFGLILSSCNRTESLIDTALSNSKENATTASSNKTQLMNGDLGAERTKVKPKWRAIKKFKGKKSRKTESFKINGKEWKVSWKTKTPPNKEDAEFILLLKNRNNKEDSHVIANYTGSDEDFSFLEGIGEYYLQINSTQDYEITIHELK